MHCNVVSSYKYVHMTIHSHAPNDYDKYVCITIQMEEKSLLFLAYMAGGGWALLNLLLNLLVLVLIDLNQRLCGRGSNRSWAGWDISWEMRLALPNRRWWYNDSGSRLGRSLLIILKAVFATLFNLNFLFLIWPKTCCDWKCQDSLDCSSVNGHHDLCGQTKLLRKYSYCCTFLTMFCINI